MYIKGKEVTKGPLRRKIARENPPLMIGTGNPPTIDHRKTKRKET